MANPKPKVASPAIVHEVVDPRWLLKAGAITLAVALLFGYLTLSLLFYQGQWQFALHPSRTVAATPESVHLPFEAVRFGVDASGTPQLTGWWIPSDTTSARTALVFHSGDGTMADALPQAAILHDAHLNVFLFDYRGYGTSGGKHPSQQTMEQDTHSAWDFLHSMRAVNPSSLVVFAEGLGAPLALHFCATANIECPALILDAPDGDLLDRVRQDQRTALVPVRLLFRETFPLADPLHSSRSPKLIFSYGSTSILSAVRNAADPKITVELPRRDDPSLDRSIKRFLDDYNTHK